MCPLTSLVHLTMEPVHERTNLFSSTDDTYTHTHQLFFLSSTLLLSRSITGLTFKSPTHVKLAKILSPYKQSWMTFPLYTLVSCSSLFSPSFYHPNETTKLYN